MGAVITVACRWTSETRRRFSSKSQGPKAAKTRSAIWPTSINIVNFFTLSAARKSDEVLEPDERKRSRPVLRGERARKPPDLLGLTNSAGHQQAVKEFKQAQKERFEIPYYPAIGPDFKRVQYNRYADDFVIGIIGSKADAEKVKQDVGVFLRDKLKLTLSEEKTKVSHSNRLIRYLGYDFTVSRSKDAERDDDGVLQRRWYGCVKLYVPHGKWFKKLQQYKAFKIVIGKDGKERWKALHRGALMNRPDLDIITKFNSEIRGIYNFYRLAHNAAVLNNFYFIMETSMFKTFASKYQTTVRKIRAKYTCSGVFGVDYVNRSGKQRCEFYHGGFKKQDDGWNDFVDILPEYRRYDRPNTLAARLKSGVCEACGAQTHEIHMHHVKRLDRQNGVRAFDDEKAQKVACAVP